MNKKIEDLADQLYSLSETSAGGEHAFKANVSTGAFNVIAFLEAIAAATPEILALLKVLLGKNALPPTS